MSALSSAADIHQADGNVSWRRQQATLREPARHRANEEDSDACEQAYGEWKDNGRVRA